MEYLSIGFITGFHGVKGEVKVKSNTDFANERFIVGAKIMLTNDRINKEVIISSVRFHKERYLIKFEGHNWLNDVEMYKGYRLCIDAQDKIVLPEDEYYVSDLIGLEVFDYNNNKIGTVLDVMNNPANDILVLEDDILIPLVSAIVNKVSLENNSITLFEIDGLW